MPRIESKFHSTPVEAPFIDGSGGMSMDMTSNLEMAFHEHYELLNHLKTPDGAYGHPTLSSFLEDLMHHLGTVQVIGEPGSGKSFVISQMADLFAKEGIRSVYIPFVDIIRDARAHGIVDPKSPFGKMNSDEYQRVSELYYIRHEQALQATEGEQRIVIGECPGIPTIEPNEFGELTAVSRGTVAVRELVSKHDAYVAGLYGSSTMRRRAKDFRYHLPELSVENASEMLERFNIATTSTDPEKVAESLRMSGAPYEAVKHYEKVIDDTLAFLASDDIGLLSIPPHQRSHDYFEGHPDKRTEIIGKTYIPYLLESEISVPEDRAFVGYNRVLQKRMTRFDLSPIHYSRIIDIDAPLPSPPSLAQPRTYRT